MRLTERKANLYFVILNEVKNPRTCRFIMRRGMNRPPYGCVFVGRGLVPRRKTAADKLRAVIWCEDSYDSPSAALWAVARMHSRLRAVVVATLLRMTGLEDGAPQNDDLGVGAGFVASTGGRPKRNSLWGAQGGRPKGTAYGVHRVEGQKEQPVRCIGWKAKKSFFPF